MMDHTNEVSGFILSQCTGANIDLNTQWVVMVVSGNFALSVRGQRNINTALNNLPINRTAEPSLTFGWGLKHALRNTGVHEDGYEHLALELVLSESFPEAYAACVLHEMAVLDATPSDVTPHISQIRDLVRSSHGITATTDLGILVEDHTRLDSDGTKFQTSLHGAWEIPSPKSLGLALKVLAQVSRESGKQMVLAGDRIIAWFAAVAEWLLDLRVAIYSGTGNRFYAKHDESEKTQVLLMFDDKPGVHAWLESFTDDSSKAKEAASRERSNLGRPNQIQLRGRVVWNSLFSRVFGRTFHDFDPEENKAIGIAIGAAARVFQGFAEDPEFAREALGLDNTGPPICGSALVQTLNDWLPELGRFRGRMERQQKLSFPEASKTYIEQVHTLQSLCACDVCVPTAKAPDRPRYCYCLLLLTEMTITLGLTLSSLTVSPAIYPTRIGVQNLYKAQLARRAEAHTLDTSDSKRQFSIIYAHAWTGPDAQRLQTVAELFTGSTPSKHVPDNLVALAHEGICVYMRRLLGSTRAQGYGLIQVVSGAINVRHKVFRRAAFGPVVEEDEFEDAWEEVPCAHLEESLWCK